MAREKATITLDRDKAAKARLLVGGRTTSEVIDIALERLIRSLELRRDIQAYLDRPATKDELALAELPVEFDLGDDEVDYDAVYGPDR
jgi:hypothetical protein